MFSRYTPTIALTLLGTGLTAGALGLRRDDQTLTWCGIFLTVTAVPLLVTRTLHHAQRISAHERAEIHNQGYRLALDHVARGLLVADPSGPTPGDPVEEPNAPNVVRLPIQPHRSGAQAG